MENGDHNESLPYAEPGGKEREDDCLDQECDNTVDGHDYAHGLRCQAQTAGDAEGSWMRGREALVLQEYGKEVVVSHGMVGEDTEGDYDHDDFAGEDFWSVVRGKRWRMG